MPMLPSGQHVGIDPGPLLDVIRSADSGAGVHHLMAINTPEDMPRVLEIVYFVPLAPGESAMADTETASLPPGMKRQPTGVRLDQSDVLMAQWPAQDREAFADFLREPRVAAQIQAWLDLAKEAQQEVLRSGSLVARVMAGWWQAGVHPAQEEGWCDDAAQPLADGRQPWEWDSYDALAAYMRIAERVRQGARLLAGWLPRADGYLAIAFQRVPGLAGYGFSDSETARELATRLRDAKLLDNAPMLTARWLKEQLVVECNQLYDSEGFDDLRPLMRGDTDIIELVALSRQAAR